MKIGLIVAMDKEYQQFINVLSSDDVQMGDNHIVLRKCGIGKVNAAVGCTLLIKEHNPDLIISSGVAGGTSDMDIMDVVVSERVVYHDVYCGPESQYGAIQHMPAIYETPKDLIKLALSSNDSANTGQTIHAGLIASGDSFIDDREKYNKVIEHFPETLAFDMESGSLAQVCHIFNVPFISFRIISDIVTKENNTKMYTDFWATVSDTSFNITKQFLERL